MSASPARNLACRLAKRPLVGENLVPRRPPRRRLELRLMGAGRGSRVRRSALALAPLACALAGLAQATNALAASEPEIPTECGSRADFDAELKKRLGDDAPLGSVHVSITPGPSRFHLRVQI